MKNVDELKQRLAASEQHLIEVQTRQGITHNRLREAEAEIPDLEAQIAALKEQRQTLLADGESVTAINKLIRSAQDDLELAQDEIIGLAAKSRRLSEEIPAAYHETAALKRTIATEEARPAVEKYNEAAEQFAAALMDVQRIDAEYEALRTNQARPLLHHPREDGTWPVKYIPRFSFFGDGELLPPAYDYEAAAIQIDIERRQGGKK